MKGIVIQLLIILAMLNAIHAQRGRVQVQDGTLVTDRGTLLRGAFVALDNPWMIMPTRDQVRAIKDLGLNTIHVYAEHPYDSSEENPQPGYSMEEVDNLVEWTSEDSLYLVLTMAGWNPNVDSFVYAFWNIYSERYKNKTHVIYEICNEPEACGDPYTSAITPMEINAYNIIRSHAPETHVLLLSSVYSIEVDSIFKRLKDIGEFVDWSNTSVAMHGYCLGVSEDIRALNQQVLDSGYTVTITEFESVLRQQYAGRALIRVFEEQQVSYLNFLEVDHIVDHQEYFKTMIERSEIRWTPEFGTWPASIADIDYYNPFKFKWGALYDEGQGWYFGPYPSDDLEYINNNDYAAYYNLNFEDEPVSFEIMCSTNNTGGDIEIHLDALNGPVVGVCSISNTGGWNTYETFVCDITTPFDGVHNIYLTFKGTEDEYLFNVRYWYFGKSQMLAPQTPYHGVASLLPGKIEAEEYDIGGSTISFLDRDKINHGSLFRTDEVDIDTTNDGGYCVAWTGESEWLEYTVSCEQETNMDIILRAACIEPGDKIRIKLDNQVLANVNLPNTGGYYDWETVTIEDVAIQAGENQILRLELHDGLFNLDWLNFVEKTSTDLDDVNNIEIIKKLELYPIFPNPFNMNTNISFDIPSSGLVKLEIFNITGELVKSLLSTTLNTGSYKVKWDTKNNEGIPIASGIYIYRLTFNNQIINRKMMLLK